ncbi:MAG: hypothetical protein EZS28_004675 [Streblomastix strix]|uniref:Uncharacterized protein n=1 Tax=Streblomastix strix TaxID=222440 RepID=A0A5J4WZ57_9EUKA|nr:MAG: hypothetical protein EZS28_004675 [Streblomastix strix]
MFQLDENKLLDEFRYEQLDSLTIQTPTMFVELQTPEEKINILVNEDRIYKLIGVVPGYQIIKHKDENGEMVEIKNEKTLEEIMINRGDILNLNQITVDLRVNFNGIVYTLNNVSSSITVNLLKKMVLLKDDSADSGGNLELIEGLATTNIWRYFGNDDEDHLYISIRVYHLQKLDSILPSQRKIYLNHVSQYTIRVILSIKS